MTAVGLWPRLRVLQYMLMDKSPLDTMTKGAEDCARLSLKQSCKGPFFLRVLSWYLKRQASSSDP